jgi:hypothetical protein
MKHPKQVKIVEYQDDSENEDIDDYKIGGFHSAHIGYLIHSPLI